MKHKCEQHDWIYSENFNKRTCEECKREEVLKEIVLSHCVNEFGLYESRPEEVWRRTK
jgi:hypothetical protein